MHASSTVDPATLGEAVTEIRDREALARLAEGLCRGTTLAVDLETNGMHAFRGRLCYVQIAGSGGISIVDTLAEGVSALGLREPFERPGIRKVFHDGQGDLRILAGEGVRIRGLFDTQRAATLLGLPKVGLGDLVESRFGVRLAKEHQTADFGMRPLPAELRAYIADDVRFLLPLAEALEEEVRAKDLWEEFSLENERIAEEANVPETLPKPKLPGPARDALGRAIAEAVDAIRYREAEKRDVPVGRVLSNATVGEIAARRPATLRQLSGIQGVKGSFLRPCGEEALRAIEDLRAAHQRGELPEPPEPPRPDPARRKREDRLKGWRAEAAKKREVTTLAVLPTPILERLAAQPPGSVEELAEIPWLGEKRLSLYGGDLLALLGEG